MARVSIEQLRARLSASIVANGTHGDYQALMDDMSDLRPSEVAAAAKAAEQDGELTLIVEANDSGKPTLRYRAEGGE